VSPSCQHDPLAAADLSQGAGGALPAAAVTVEHILSASFITARVRLMNLINRGSLVPASVDAYACGLAKLARRAPAGALSAAAHIIVRISEPAIAAGVVVLPVRWHAIGTRGQLVRVLSADLILIQAQAEGTLVRLQGAFRLPFAVPGAGPDRDELPRRAAAASMSFLLDHITKELGGQAPRADPATAGA
jgi:hypothetical protein